MTTLFRKCLYIIIFVGIIYVIVAYLIENVLFKYDKQIQHSMVNNPFLVNQLTSKNKMLSGDISNKNTEKIIKKSVSVLGPDENVHVFYYPWYRNVQYDGNYLHWNHRYLPHWNDKEALRWPKGRHEPPGDIGANFYPELGPYSSKDPQIINKHMEMIKESGAGVLVVSWYPPHMADDEGEDSDSIITSLLDAAKKFDLKICLHVEPFKGRNAESIRTHIGNAIDKYAHHSAYFKYLSSKSKKMLPVFYLYDSYLVSDQDWKSLLQPTGELTIRGTSHDAIFIGLLLKLQDAKQLADNGFDAFYTYFGSQKFTEGAAVHNWGALRAEATKLGLFFVPSVSPGYVDVRVRPWNGANTNGRENGMYYENYWSSAVDHNADVISITSFNEWHEGTQIEPAVPFTFGGFRYEDYLPNPSNFYLQLTRKWVLKFRLRRKKLGLI